MRYFFISFSHSNGLGFGNLDIQIEEFPSRDGIERSIREANPEMEDTEITILSIFEFKSKEDFEAFIGKED
jgi:hypothetical protein